MTAFRWATVAICAALAGAALVSCSSGGQAGRPADSAAPTASSIEQDIGSLDALQIASAPNPDWITVVDGQAWVANVDTGLVSYDDKGEITATVPTGSIDLAMDVGFGSLWLGSRLRLKHLFEVLRVDLSDPTHVEHISLEGASLPGESSVGVTEKAVWVLTESSSLDLVGIDPATNTIVTRIPAPTGASAVRGGFGSLWVTSHSTGTLTRIDPDTGEVQASVDVGPGPQFLAIGGDAVWVMNQADGSVSRVDPDTNAVVATVAATAGAINGGDIAAGSDAVWVRTSSELAVKIDPATNDVVDRIGPAAGSGSIGFDADAVWISAHDIRTVWRVPQE